MAFLAKINGSFFVKWNSTADNAADKNLELVKEFGKLTSTSEILGAVSGLSSMSVSVDTHSGSGSITSGSNTLVDVVAGFKKGIIGLETTINGLGSRTITAVDEGASSFEFSGPPATETTSGVIYSAPRGLTVHEDAVIDGNEITAATAGAFSSSKIEDTIWIQDLGWRKIVSISGDVCTFSGAGGSSPDSAFMVYVLPGPKNCILTDAGKSRTLDARIVDGRADKQKLTWRINC